MKTIPHYCQNCGGLNQLGERDCRSCGTRLMLVVFPPSIRHDESIVPSFYEDHLLERVTLLEIRLSQVAERLATALELMFRQTKSAHSDRLLIETIIDSLTTLGTVEKDKLESDWLKKLGHPAQNQTGAEKSAKLLKKITENSQNPPGELFVKLVKEGFSLLSKGDEGQAMRILERASALSPTNKNLLSFIAQTHFCGDKTESAETYADKFLRLDDNNAAAILLSAVIKADLGKSDSAVALLEKIKNYSEAFFCVYYISAMVAVFENKSKDALSYFKAALSVNDAPEIQYLTGCAYYQLGKYKFALKHIRQAVEADTNYADAWFMIGKVFEATGEESKSLQAADIARASREQGAQCREFLHRSNKTLTAALPFIRLQNISKNLLTGGAPRLAKFFKTEICKILESNE